MTYRSTIATLMFATAQLGFTAGVHAEVNRMRCEARLMRSEGNLYQCFSNCNERLQPIARTASYVAAHSRCQSNCEDRARSRREKIESRPPCKDRPIQPDPLECRARYLQLGAKEMLCKADCDSDADCVSDCQVRYETQLDELRAKPICKNGWPASPLVADTF